MATVMGCHSLNPSNASSSVSMTQQSMPERILGKTQVKVPILGLGGAGRTPLSQRGQEQDAIALAAENPTQLEANVKVAQQYQPLTPEAMTEIAQLTVNAEDDGSFFRRWT